MLPKSALEAVQHVCSRRSLHIPGSHHIEHSWSENQTNNFQNWQSFKLDPTSGKSTVVGDQEAEHYFAK